MSGVALYLPWWSISIRSHWTEKWSNYSKSYSFGVTLMAAIDDSICSIIHFDDWSARSVDHIQRNKRDNVTRKLYHRRRLPTCVTGHLFYRISFWTRTKKNLSPWVTMNNEVECWQRSVQINAHNCSQEPLSWPSKCFKNISTLGSRGRRSSRFVTVIGKTGARVVFRLAFGVGRVNNVNVPDKRRCGLREISKHIMKIWWWWWHHKGEKV